MEETWTVTTPEGAVTVRHNDPARELLFGFYIADLISNPPRTRYSYRPPLSTGYYPYGYSYVPPDVWADWSPLQRSLWIESARENELMDYEYKLQSIKDDLIYDLKREMERAKDDVVDDLKREREKTEDERSALNLDWLNSIPAKIETTPQVPGIEKKAGTGFDFSFLANSLPGKGIPVRRELLYEVEKRAKEEAEVWWKNFRKKWKLEKD